MNVYIIKYFLILTLFTAKLFTITFLMVLPFLSSVILHRISHFFKFFTNKFCVLNREYIQDKYFLYLKAMSGELLSVFNLLRILGKLRLKGTSIYLNNLPIYQNIYKLFKTFSGYIIYCFFNSTILAFYLAIVNITLDLISPFYGKEFIKQKGIYFYFFTNKYKFYSCRHNHIGDINFEQGLERDDYLSSLCIKFLLSSLLAPLVGYQYYGRWNIFPVQNNWEDQVPPIYPRCSSKYLSGKQFSKVVSLGGKDFINIYMSHQPPLFHLYKVEGISGVITSHRTLIFSSNPVYSVLLCAPIMEQIITGSHPFTSAGTF